MDNGIWDHCRAGCWLVEAWSGIAQAFGIDVFRSRAPYGLTLDPTKGGMCSCSFCQAYIWASTSPLARGKRMTNLRHMLRDKKS